MTTLAVGEQGVIPDSGGNEQRALRQATAAAGVPHHAMTLASPEGGGGINNGHLTTMADPEGGGGIGGGNFGPTTLAVGEEGGGMQIPPMSVTNAIGEDGQGIGGGFKPPNLETRAIPENGGGIGGGGNINTMALGEQGGSIQIPKLPPAAMTMAFPESGGGIGGGMMPTFGPANSEMGRPPMSVTQAVGEDGRFPPPMSGPVTQAIGEDGAIGSPSIPGQNPFDFSTFKSDLLTGIGDLFKKYFDETSSPFGGNEITPPPAPGETKPTMSPGDLVAPSSNYGSLASQGMQSPFRGL